MIPLVDVKAQYEPFIPELRERFAEILESGRFIFGPEVEGFEREAAAYLGVPHAIGRVEMLPSMPGGKIRS